MTLAYKFSNKSIKDQFTAKNLLAEYMHSANVIKDVIYNLYINSDITKVGYNRNSAAVMV